MYLSSDKKEIQTLKRFNVPLKTSNRYVNKKLQVVNKNQKSTIQCPLEIINFRPNTINALEAFLFQSIEYNKYHVGFCDILTCVGKVKKYDMQLNFWGQREKNQVEFVGRKKVSEGRRLKMSV